MHFQRFPPYLEKDTFNFTAGKHISAGIHNILKIKKSGVAGWHVDK